LMLFGDYVDQHPRWAAYKKIDLEYAAAIRAGGGTVDGTNLPDVGIRGNSHMLMQDKNNAEIADVIQTWMVGKGLVECPRSTVAQLRFQKEKGGRHAPFRSRLAKYVLARPRCRYGLGAGQGTHSFTRHGFVPRRRAGHRDHRPADQGDRVHAWRRAREDGPERQVS